jgi:hypothetical protein
METIMRTTPTIALLACLSAAPSLAQSSGEPWNGLPDRFQIDTGYFRLNADTVLRFDGGPGVGDIDFERDLALDEKADTFWLDATWRLGRRHQLKLSFTRLSRDRDGHSLQRDFVWGGQTFNAGLSANATADIDVLGGYYRFAIYRNDRFEIGPTVGIGYLWLTAGIEATGTFTPPGGSPITRSLDESATKGSITGAVGGYATAWPAKRLVLRSDFLYIKVNPENAEASVTDWRVGANFYFLRNVGVGAQYKYNEYRYDRDIASSELGGKVELDGFQAFLSFLF